MYAMFFKLTWKRITTMNEWNSALENAAGEENTESNWYLTQLAGLDCSKEYIRDSTVPCMIKRYTWVGL